MNGFDVIHKETGILVDAKELANTYAPFTDIDDAYFVITDYGEIQLMGVDGPELFDWELNEKDYSIQWHKTPVEELTENLSTMFENGVHWTKRKYHK